jgi:hypothetical protein
MRKTLILVALMVCCFILTAFTLGKPKISPKELSPLLGERWRGTLTYRDFSQNKDYSIPVEIIVTQSSADANEWLVKFEYPKEPNANGEQTIKLSDGGTRFDGGILISKTKLSNKTLQFVTEKEGKDNNREATLRYTYTLNQTNFSIKKEVRYKNEADYFLRNEYKVSRQNKTHQSFRV